MAEKKIGTIGDILDFKNKEGRWAEPKKEEKKWFGKKPTHCQLCGAELTGLFVDARTLSGPWALMCVLCWHSQGGRIGTGYGQMYDLTTLKKVAG